MSQFRLVALAVIGAAGCYSPPPESTFPESAEQHYVSGPPGGAIDPEQPAYAAPEAPGTVTFQGDNADATDDDDLAGEPSDLAVSSSAAVAPDDDGARNVAGPIAGPVAPNDDTASEAYDANDAGGAYVDAYGNTDSGAYDADGQLGAPGAPSIAEGPVADLSIAPTASVTDVEIDATLDGHGQWVETQDYGQVWRPDATVVGVDFTPYESAGSWAYTDTGWSFNCDYSWGWLPFHYGRWSWFGDYWGWVPGHRWASSWVDWRHGSGVIGWRPAPPRVLDRTRLLHRQYRYGRGNVVRDHRRAQVRDSHWRFASTSNFSRPRIRSHVFRDSAQGLRVTSRVSAPPLRARTS
ncbi:MAG: hypothetical protein H7138_06550, partial [Myxococcales bacterium]|nr:hypothetical protein [Myxococcales bacterium]